MEVRVLKKVDLIIAGGVVVIAAILYFSGILRPSGEGAEAVITIDGELYNRYNLNEDTTVTIEIPDVGFNTFSINNGKVDMINADCRDHICVDHIPISLNGETIICLPHKLIIEIESGDESAVDSAVQ